MKCPICSQEPSVYHSIIAPWITQLANEPLTPSQFFVCNSCSFSYFSRFSNQMATRLYSNYRSQQYFVTRNSWEPWFGKNENDFFKETDSVDIPKNILERKRDILEAFNLIGLSLSDIHGCLDFGGDSGQFIPSEIKGLKYIVDPQIAHEYFKNGIRFVADLEVIDKRSLGLIMSCMVLEHVNDVNNTIREMVKLLSDRGYLYLEVPMDSFRVSKIHQTGYYRRYLNFLSRRKFLFQLFDFSTGVWRLFFKRIPFWGILKQSEHINYFNYRTLGALIDKFNFIPVCKIERAKSRQGKLKLGKIQLLAELQNRTL